MTTINFDYVNDEGLLIKWHPLEIRENGVFEFRSQKSLYFDGIDGPYVLNNKQFNISSNNTLIESEIPESNRLLVKVDTDKSFEVDLDYLYEDNEDNYDNVDEIIAISDIEGRFDQFTSFLISNGVICEDLNWIFGDGHLVLNGDIVDRGDKVTQTLWLIYKLEYEAKTFGGRVHYILGNHEVMNIKGQWKYSPYKYIKAAQEISQLDEWNKSVQYMYSDETFLGKWLTQKNTIVKLNNYLFVHGGLTPDILEYECDIKSINNTIRKYFDNFDSSSSFTDFLLSKNGPFWFRGFFEKYDTKQVINSTSIWKLKDFYQFRKIIIGHTKTDDIKKLHDSNIIAINAFDQNTNIIKGILIQDDFIYKLDESGFKKKLN